MNPHEIKSNHPKLAFDSAAQQYDDEFTNSTIGKLQRQRVYHWLEKSGFFSSPKKVFEINCGTGYDAEHFTLKGHEVVATDASPGMIEFAKQKRNPAIDFFKLSFDEVADHPTFQESEVLFSNFGGLNCICHEELKRFTSAIADKQNQGDQLIWVIMPKYCLMESFYFLSKLQFSKVFRRNSNKGIDVNVGDGKVKTYYHSPKELKEILRKNYRIKLIKPVAFVLPPSYLEPFFKEKKRSLNLLNKMESMFGTFNWPAALSDHFILIAEKR